MRSFLSGLLVVLVGAASCPRVTGAQPALPKHEFRGAWMATVANLDWPSVEAQTADQQKAQMVQWLDALRAAGVNAVLLQIRPEADALYASSFEPWSVFLTGQQGLDPGYDPLAFAVEEAHRRGMELHAWFNPYRVWTSSRNYPRDPSSVYLTKPDWLLTINNAITILNPGIPDVRSYVIDVIRDVVTRYDVDGVHFDDYFYPYPPNQITNQDAATYQQYGSGFALATWRTYNVNMLVRGVWEMLQAEAPDVVFGISPFGIWKSGTPPGISGLSGATDLYADAVIWMEQGWLDYLTPQLYWAFGGGQDYGKLAPWWAGQVNGRHLYPGHGLYRTSSSTYSGTLFSASEIPNQVRFNRANGIPGSVFFRTRNITSFSSKGFADTLKTDLYRHPALPPPMPWKNLMAPPVPRDFVAMAAGTQVTLSWRSPAADPVLPDGQFYAVYRVQGSAAPDWLLAADDPANLVTVTGDTTWVDTPGSSDEPYWYTVTAVSRNSVESDPAPAQSVIATGVQVDVPVAFRLDAAYPNPFRNATTIRYAVPRAGQVSVAVHDALGRTVTRLVNDRWQPAGEYEVRWEAASAPVASGTYVVLMQYEGAVQARTVVFVR